jgi:hypothetical protein
MNVVAEGRITVNVLALNGSPRAENSSTYHMLKPLLEGMEQAGATTDILHIHQLHLKPCLGCYTCWTRTPGVCVQKDGMADALQKHLWADFLIIGTPLYFFLMSAQLKTFIDRLLPLSEPSLIARANDPSTTAHPSRFGTKERKVLLVSPCGFPEYQNFDALVFSLKFLAGKSGWTYAGEILRSGAEPLSQAALQPFFAGYYALLRQAGEQLARECRISDALQQELRRDLFPIKKEEFYSMADAYWKLRASTGGTDRAESGDTATAPTNDRIDSDRQPKTLRGQMLRMTGRFLPEAAGSFRGDIQFDFSGGEAGQYYLHIENGGCLFRDGLSPAPRLTMHVSSEDWQAMGRGELAGPQAFMSGKLKVDGDFGLMMKWRDFFASN